MNTLKEDRLFNKGYLIYVIFQTLNFTLLYLSVPVLPKYIYHICGNISIAGLISGAFAISSLIARPFAGYAADAFNRKKVIVISLFICSFTTIALSFTDSTAILTTLRLIYGVGVALLSTLIVSCATTFIPKSRTAEGIGYIGLGVAVAAAIGPALGLYLSSVLGYVFTFFLVGIAYLACFLLLAIAPKAEYKSSGTKQRLSLSLKNLVEKRAVFYAVLVIPFAIGVGFVNGFIALTAEERNIANIGLFFSVYAIVMMLLKPLSGKLQDKKGLSAALVPAFVCCIVAQCLIAESYSLAPMLIAALFLAFGQGAGQPSLQAKCVSVASAGKTGIAISTYYIGQDLGNGLGSIFGANIAEKFGYTGAYYFCMILLVLGLALYLIGQKTFAKENAREA